MIRLHSMKDVVDLRYPHIPPQAGRQRRISFEYHIPSYYSQYTAF